MEEFLINNGLPAMFLMGVLAASLLPVGSEWLLVALIMNGQNVNHLIITATVGNYLGSCTTYLVGIWGTAYITTRIMRISATQQLKAKNIYKKYGVWSLLLAWLPVIGDPLCLIGGVMRTNFWIFSLLVITGKFIRYALVAAITTTSL